MGPKRFWVLTGGILTVLSAQGVPMAETEPSAPAVDAASAQSQQPMFSAEPIDQMVAPIALYSLLGGASLGWIPVARGLQQAS